MVNNLSQPTPYAEVNAILMVILTGAQAVLGDRFSGMYLYGSLAGGDFDPQHSDIDFVVVTAGELTGDQVAALAAMHDRIADSGLVCADRIEGAYIPREALRRYDPDRAEYPHLGVGERLRVEWHDSAEVIQRHVLRERGVVIAGPAPHTLIDAVSTDDMRRAVLNILRGWWAPVLEDPVRLDGHGYQPYAVLTMCRMHYTLCHGSIVSKPAAARWALAALDARWTGLIKRALAHEPASGDVGETVELIRFTLEHALSVS